MKFSEIREICRKLTWFSIRRGQNEPDLRRSERYSPNRGIPDGNVGKDTSPSGSGSVTRHEKE
jgi:hypothetical protein